MRVLPGSRLALAGLILLIDAATGAAGTAETAPDLAACRSFLSGLVASARANDTAALKSAFRDPSEVESSGGPAQMARFIDQIEVVRCEPRSAGVAFVHAKLKPGQGPPEAQGEERVVFAVRQEMGRTIALSSDEMRYFDVREASAPLNGAWSVPFRFNSRLPADLAWRPQEKHLWITAAGEAIRFRLRFDRPLTEIRLRPEKYVGPYVDVVVLFDADGDASTGYPVDSYPQYGVPGLDRALSIKGKPAGGRWEMTIGWHAIVRDTDGRAFELKDTALASASAIETGDGDLRFELPARVLDWRKGSRLAVLVEPQASTRLPIEYVIP